MYIVFFLILEKFTYFVQKFADVSYPVSEDAIAG
jgi:hypothetical protein